MKKLFTFLLLIFSLTIFSQQIKLKEIKEIARSIDQKGNIASVITSIYEVVYKGNKIEKIVNYSAFIENLTPGQTGTSTIKNNFEIQFTYDASSNLILREEQSIVNGKKYLKSKIEYVYNNLNQMVELNSYSTGGTIPRKWTFSYLGNKLDEILWVSSPAGGIDRKDKLTWKNNNPTNFNSYESKGKLINSITVVYDLKKVNKFNNDFPLYFIQNIRTEINNIYQYLGQNEIIKIIEPSNIFNKNPLPYEIEYDNIGYPIRIKRGPKGGYEHFFIYQ